MYRESQSLLKLAFQAYWLVYRISIPDFRPHGSEAIWERNRPSKASDLGFCSENQYLKKLLLTSLEFVKGESTYVPYPKLFLFN